MTSPRLNAGAHTILIGPKTLAYLRAMATAGGAPKPEGNQLPRLVQAGLVRWSKLRFELTGETVFVLTLAGEEFLRARLLELGEKLIPYR
jgi:hypothetical protein